MSRLRVVLIVLLLSCLSFAQEIRRPTVNTVPASGISYVPGTTTNGAGSTMPNFYDTSGMSSSSALVAGSYGFYYSLFTNWAPASGSYAAVTLNVNAACSGSGAYSGCLAYYSTNSGTTWTAIFSTVSLARQTYTITIPAGSLSTLQVLVGVAAYAGSAETLTGYDIWTSGTLAVRPAPTVSWSTAPPASATYGSQFTVVASSNSTGAITYGVTGGCTISGSTVTMTSGTTACGVTASVAADSNYSAGSVGPTSVTASRSTPTVSWSTAPPTSATYGSQFTVVASSNSVGAITYSVTGGCTISGSTVTMTNGTTACVVTASVAADSNYSAGSVGPTSVTSSRSTQTISFPNPGPQLEGSPLTLAATASSGLPVSYTITSGSGIAQLNGTVVTFSGIGSVQVTASQGGNSNYSAATPVVQSFPVTAPPVVSGVSPSNGPLGSLVTITGTNLGISPGTVTIGGSTASVVSWNTNAIIAWVPTAVSANTLAIQVTVDNQSSNTTVVFSVTGSPATNPTCP